MWPVRRQTPSVMVPASAVVETPEGVFVETVAAGSVKIVPVQRGKASADLVEVFGDVKAGEMVIERGSEDLAAGTRVIPREKAATETGR